MTRGTKRESPSIETRRKMSIAHLGHKDRKNKKG